MKKILDPLFASLLIFCGCDRRPVTSVEIAWTHPQIQDAPKSTITDAAVATRLYKLFEDIDKPQAGTPYDTPFYDASLTFTLADGRTLGTKVYLPRERTFPGMWKHPSGPLNYFDPDKQQPRELVSILKPLMPRHAVYPDHLDPLPPVQFNKGIPDFTHINLPISGDFPKGSFH